VSVSGTKVVVGRGQRRVARKAVVVSVVEA